MSTRIGEVLLVLVIILLSILPFGVNIATLIGIVLCIGISIACLKRMISDSKARKVVCSEKELLITAANKIAEKKYYSGTNITVFNGIVYVFLRDGKSKFTIVGEVCIFERASVPKEPLPGECIEAITIIDLEK